MQPRTSGDMNFVKKARGLDRYGYKRGVSLIGSSSSVMCSYVSKIMRVSIVVLFSGMQGYLVEKKLFGQLMCLIIMLLQK